MLKNGQAWKRPPATAPSAAGTRLSTSGTLAPAVKVETSGDANPTRDAQIAKEAQALPEVPDVPVTQGEIPEGLDLQEESTKLVVQPGYEQRYRILGVVEADYMAVKGVFVKNWLWTWTDYKSTGKKVACYVQAPLKAVTLSIWGWLPWAYPCMRYAPGEESERAADLLDGMRRGAAAMGGNRVVLIGTSDLIVTTVSEYGSSQSHTGTVKMRGFVIDDKGEAVGGGVDEAPTDNEAEADLPAEEPGSEAP